MWQRLHLQEEEEEENQGGAERQAGALTLAARAVSRPGRALLVDYVTCQNSVPCFTQINNLMALLLSLPIL